MSFAAFHRLALICLFCLLEGSSAARGDASLPRLAGIVVGPHMRQALFIDRTNGFASFYLEEGGAIAGLKILTINSDSVVLVGPSGTTKLELEQGVGAITGQSPPAAEPTPDLTTLQAGVTKSGASIGLLALQRDKCARAGLLRDNPADSEAKVQRLIAAIHDLPVREGAGGAHNAPSQLLAAALSAGLDAARQRVVYDDLDTAACMKVNASWSVNAGRYGLQ